MSDTWRVINPDGSEVLCNYEPYGLRDKSKRMCFEEGKKAGIEEERERIIKICSDIIEEIGESKNLNMSYWKKRLESQITQINSQQFGEATPKKRDNEKDTLQLSPADKRQGFSNNKPVVFPASLKSKRKPANLSRMEGGVINWKNKKVKA